MGVAVILELESKVIMEPVVWHVNVDCRVTCGVCLTSHRMASQH